MAKKAKTSAKKNVKLLGPVLEVVSNPKSEANQIGRREIFDLIGAGDFEDGPCLLRKSEDNSSYVLTDVFGTIFEDESCWNPDYPMSWFHFHPKKFVFKTAKEARKWLESLPQNFDAAAAARMGFKQQGC